MSARSTLFPAQWQCCSNATARPFPLSGALVWTLAWPLTGLAVGAAAQPVPAPALPRVTISAKAPPDPVEKSYRRMIRGLDLFERRHALAPQASLRFLLLPRRPDTDMSSVQVDLLGATLELRVPVAADFTFELPRNRQAWEEDAVVSPNRRAMSMTWRTEIRTPGWPAQTRRLGDLRLECEVGVEAGLISNPRSFVQRLVDRFAAPIDQCQRADSRYLFFAERPLFGVTLVHGARRETLPVDGLYAGASADPDLEEDLPYCDCEVLVDRSYFLPLGDRTWPDDTRVEFEFMQDTP
jgi:hypothetical protein